jgi:HAD superfamily hydrolase (TIGR01549 family)
MYTEKDSNKTSASVKAPTKVTIFSRFDVLMLDAMNTVFLAKGGKYHLYQEFLRTLGIEVETPRLAEVFARKRAQFESLAKIERREGREVDVEEMWSKINASIVTEFAQGRISGSAEEIGRRIHNEFQGNPNGFRVHEDMRQFLKIAHGKILIAIASNHQKDYLPKFISSFNLEHLVGRVFTSEELGFEKPDPRFFYGIIKELSAIMPGLKPDRVLMVGNNPVNDISGAKEAGIKHAVLLDWEKDFNGDKTVPKVSSPLELLRLEFPV